MEKQKEGTIEWYLEMSDEEFIKEMDKFEEWLKGVKEQWGLRNKNEREKRKFEWV